MFNGITFFATCDCKGGNNIESFVECGNKCIEKYLNVLMILHSFQIKDLQRW